MMIKAAFVLLIAPLICSAEFATGGPIQSSTKAKPCPACKEMEMLESRFSKLHVNVPNQYQTGSDPVMMKPVVDISARLHKEAKGKRGEQFYQELESLVMLVAASLPFDIETQGAADLVQIIRTKDKNTRKIYENALGQVRDKCRKEFLAISIKERECILDFEALKKPERYLDRDCPLSKFDYKECEAKNK